jgi:hypothetical protein
MNAVQSMYGVARRVVSSSLMKSWSSGIPSMLSNFQQQRFMSKYLSKSAKKRLPLTTKRVAKGFYKGNGSTKEGRLSNKGRFIVDPLKRLELIVPDLTGFKVRFSGRLCEYSEMWISPWLLYTYTRCWSLCSSSPTSPLRFPDFLQNCSGIVFSGLSGCTMKF